MSESKLYNTGTSDGYIQALDQLHYFKSISATIEIKQVKLTRSNAQNRALYLYFTFVAETLNNHGLYFQTIDLFSHPLEMQWDKDLVKQFIWLPIQKTLFDIESTTKLTTTDINTILDVLTNHFAKLKLSVSFPNQFDYYLKQIGY